MIYIVRHGQTEGNRGKVLQGRGSDQHLNEKGIQQAGLLQRYFEREKICFDRVYSSPLTRALETARILCGGDAAGRGDMPFLHDDKGIREDDLLLEMDYGPYEGADLQNPPPELIRFFSDFAHNPAPEGMEPLDSVVRRLGRFLEKIREEAAAGQTILISTHAIAMKGALEYLSPGSDGSWWSRYIANCALFAFKLGEAGYTVPEEILIAEKG